MPLLEAQGLVKSFPKSMGDVEVLRTNRPNMGFEESAIEAVKQWRYKPAMQGSRPVDVYFTVVVEFDLAYSNLNEKRV